MSVSKKQFQSGRKGAEKVRLGFNRRDFLRTSVAVPAAAGALYVGYQRMRHGPVRAALIGSGQHGRERLIPESPPGYLKYVAYHDIRPSQKQAGREAFIQYYGAVAGNQVVLHENFDDLLKDSSIEAVVIATPTSTHAKLVFAALEAGKHVYCEAPLAENITNAKAMVKLAEGKPQLRLFIGHHRRYSVRYDEAREYLSAGTLGDLKFIEAYSHWNVTHPAPANGTGEPAHWDPWKSPIPPEDRSINPDVYGFKSLEELAHWRLFERLGGGLMLDRAVHQLDIIHALLGEKEGLPIAVRGMQTSGMVRDGREMSDQVHCLLEYPQGRVVSYSALVTNALSGAGEMLLGSRGSLMILDEQKVELYNEPDPLSTKRAEMKAKKTEVVLAKAQKSESVAYAAPTGGGAAKAAASSSGMASVGYREALQEFALAIRHPTMPLRCTARDALAATVIALAAREAMQQGKRLEFNDLWFNPESSEVPDQRPTDLDFARRVNLVG